MDWTATGFAAFVGASGPSERTKIDTQKGLDKNKSDDLHSWRRLGAQGAPHRRLVCQPIHYIPARHRKPLHIRCRVYPEDSIKACGIREKTLGGATTLSKYEMRLKDLYDAYEYYASKYLSVEEGRKIKIRGFLLQMFKNPKSPSHQMPGVFLLDSESLNVHDGVIKINPSGGE